MFVLKLKKWVFRNEELGGDAGGSSGGDSGGTPMSDTSGFDMDKGLSTISEDLFGSDAGEGEGGKGSAGESKPEPDPSNPAKSSPANPVSGPATPPVAAPAPGTPPAAATPPGTTTPAPSPDAFPKTWKQTPELQAKWAAIDPEVKAEVQRREDDMYRGLEQYKADASIGKSIKQITAPYEHILTHYNINPLQQIQGLMKAHHDLSMGTPEMRVAMFRQLAKDYNVNLESAAAEAPYEDPQVVALRQENQRLQSEQQRIAEEARGTTQRVLAQQLDTFFSDTRFPDAQAVGMEMVPFVNQGFSLEEAYQKAIWVNPVTRAKLLERQQADSAAAAQKAEADRVAKVKAATSANVRTSSRSGTATGPTGSMEDTMMETLRGIRSRS